MSSPRVPEGAQPAQRINLAQLREAVAAGERDVYSWYDDAGAPEPAVVLALLDAVEAAQHVREARALLAYAPAKLTPAALDQATRHLNAALDRFEFVAAAGEQQYETHEDDSSEEGNPTCSVCEQWGDRIAALELTLSRFDFGAQP